MSKSRFTEEQIIGMIKEQEAGLPTAEVCRNGLVAVLRRSPISLCHLGFEREWADAAQI